MKGNLFLKALISLLKYLNNEVFEDEFFDSRKTFFDPFMKLLKKIWKFNWNLRDYLEEFPS